MSVPIEWWVAFNVLMIVMLALDLGVFHRRGHVDTLMASVWWSVIWVVVALLFNLWLWRFWPTGGELKPNDAGLRFFTGYLIERALSIDNLFVFLILFRYFRVPPQYQFRVLFWGVIGAIVLRAAFIAAGVTLIARFHWIIYIFGAFLIYTGVKMALAKGTEVHPERNPVLRLARRMLPLAPDYVEDRFFTRVNECLMATPLFVVVLVVATTDIVFALDSIPAILAITTDAFIVYTSNVFAILGLRALYFVLVGVVDYFEYLHYGLAGVLAFVGVKMLLEAWRIEIPIGWSLGAVAVMLGVAVIASILHRGGAPPGVLPPDATHVG